MALRYNSPVKNYIPLAPQGLRQQVPNMRQPSFYMQQQQPSPEELAQPSIAPRVPQISSPNQTPVGGVPQIQKASTLEHLLGSVEKLKNRQMPNQLLPGERVKAIPTDLSDPSRFSGIYQRLETTKQIGEEALATEKIKSANRHAKYLQDIYSQQIEGYAGGALLEGGGGSYNWSAIRRSGSLGMLGPVKPWVRNAAREISGLFGIDNIGGHATSGHIPGSDHYTGHAIDVMAGGTTGNRVKSYALRNISRLGVKYIIFNRRYYSASNGWKGERYTGSNPHTGHVHISFGNHATAYAQRNSGGSYNPSGLSGSRRKNFGYAQQVAPKYGWGRNELKAWYTLGMKESGWNNYAQNPTSTAYGIGQFLNSTWGAYGFHKSSDPYYQVKAMAAYIRKRYGSPSRALAFHRSHNWY